MTMSRITAAHSITKMCEIDVRLSLDLSRCQTPPWSWIVMSIAA